MAVIAYLTFSLLQPPIPISHAEEPLQIEEVYAIICQPQYLWDCNFMVAVAHRESNFIPTATNYDCYPYHLNPVTSRPYICIGLLQNMGESPQLLDPYYNVEISYQKWLLSGYTPWGY